MLNKRFSWRYMALLAVLVVTILPVIGCEQEVDCPCAELFYRGAWLDQNENGVREPEEPCLSGVVIRAEWYRDEDRENLVTRDVLTDRAGLAEIMTTGCFCGSAVLDLVVPSGYRLTGSVTTRRDGRDILYYGLARVPGTSADPGVSEVYMTVEKP